MHNYDFQEENNDATIIHRHIQIYISEEMILSIFAKTDAKLIVKV